MGASRTGNRVGEMNVSRKRVDGFLSDVGWADAKRLKLDGDLSSRKFMRLVRPGGSGILMDAYPDNERSTEAFVRMTEWLRKANLSAPMIIAGKPDDGLLLLEDLGDLKVAGLFEAERRRRVTLYTGILDLLIHIRNQAPPPLACPSALDLVRMTLLADDYYPGLDASGLSAFRSLLETVLADLVAESPSVSLRDFHADNLMWLPDRNGFARFGILDYQDAFLTHPVYDLVSLLTDARTEIDPEFRAEMVRKYAKKSGDDPERLGIAFAAFSAQRNLRILGIFFRSARDHGKTHHLSKVPRVHRYLVEALSHPVFADVSASALAAIPSPEPSLGGKTS